MLWLHAASVGEAVSLLPVIKVLAASPVAILLTTGTVTSAAVLNRQLPEMGLQDRVLHRFVPLDVPAWVARFLDHWHPDAVGFVESELWPNLLAGCRTRGIPMMLINARISAGSLKAWQRAPAMARAILGHFSHIHARGQEDAERLRTLGATGVTSPGDLKFSAPALAAEPSALAQLRWQVGKRPVWVAASTHPRRGNRDRRRPPVDRGRSPRSADHHRAPSSRSRCGLGGGVAGPPARGGGCAAVWRGHLDR